MKILKKICSQYFLIDVERGYRMNRLKKDFILAIENLKIDIINNSDKLDSYELGNIKSHARDLYETLVWLQCMAEETGK